MKIRVDGDFIFPEEATNIASVLEGNGINFLNSRLLSVFVKHAKRGRLVSKAIMDIFSELSRLDDVTPAEMFLVGMFVQYLISSVNPSFFNELSVN